MRGSDIRPRITVGIVCALLAACQEPASSTGAPRCTEGQTTCGSTCTDTQTDSENCGTCGNACSEGRTCTGGSCSCGFGKLACGDDCVDPQTDPTHCGASGDCLGANAGTTCPGGCVEGACACDAGLLRCGAVCVDPLKSPVHCGARGDCQGEDAGAACGPDLLCVDGVCACPDGEVRCGGECIDPRTNQNFCGATGECLGASAGMSCNGTEVCDEGSCVCAAGLVDCAGDCVDPLTDEDHCGARNTCEGAASGRECAPEATCEAGACACPGGQVQCGSSCIDPLANDAFCGATGTCEGPEAGTACDPAEACFEGACESTDASLVSLGVSAGVLAPSFDPGLTTYDLHVGLAADEVVLTPVARSARATILVNGARIGSGESSAPVLLDGRSITLEVEAPGGATMTYQVDPSRVSLATALKASDATREDQFGANLAGAPGRVAVGVPARIVGGNHSAGTAYVFVREPLGWREDGILHAAHPDERDIFGQAVAVDGHRVAVGAPNEDGGSPGVGGNEQSNSSIDSGAAYVFVREAGGWKQEAYVKASNPDPGDNFGWALALSGDTLAVGSTVEASSDVGIDGDDRSNGARYSGAVYVYVRRDGAWSQQAYVKASDSHQGLNFGGRIALDGDTMAVCTSSGLHDAAVYLFSRVAGKWKEDQKIPAPPAGAEGYPSFGQTLALSGDTLVVASPGDWSGASGIDGDEKDTTARGSGAVRVYVRRDGTWSRQAYIKPSNTGMFDQFGVSLGLRGDWLLVGAPLEDGSASGLGGIPDDLLVDAGAAYLFHRVGGKWGQVEYVKSSKAQEATYFGIGVTLAGDVAVVGAPVDGTVPMGDPIYRSGTGYAY